MAKKLLSTLVSGILLSLCAQSAQAADCGPGQAQPSANFVKAMGVAMPPCMNKEETMKWVMDHKEAFAKAGASEKAFWIVMVYGGLPKDELESILKQDPSVATMMQGAAEPAADATAAPAAGHDAPADAAHEAPAEEPK
jgi:hypothetical protein